MDDQPTLIDAPKRKGWPKGKPRKARPEFSIKPEEFEDLQAPIYVKVRLKGAEAFEFGCSEHFVENGFHVFVYPSLRDRYRQTRREIAVSEVIDIEITGAFNLTRPSALPEVPSRILPSAEIQPRGDGRPVIHSAKEDALIRMRQMAAGEGPVKLEAVPGITLSGSDG